MDIAESIINMAREQQDAELAKKKIQMEVEFIVTGQNEAEEDFARTDKLILHFQNIKSFHVINVNGVEFMFPSLRCKKLVRNAMYNVLFAFIDAFMEWQNEKHINMDLDPLIIMNVCISNVNGVLMNINTIDVTDTYISLINFDDDIAHPLKHVKSVEFEDLFSMVWTYIQDILYITNVRN